MTETLKAKYDLCAICGYYHVGGMGHTSARFTASELDAWHGADGWADALRGATHPIPEPGDEHLDASPEVEEERRFYSRLQPLLTEANRLSESYYLAGEPVDVHEALRRALLAFAEEVVAVRAHDHVWDDEDRCVVCGRDGRA